MYNNQYALAYNPFDKQQLPEKDCFRIQRLSGDDGPP